MGFLRVCPRLCSFSSLPGLCHRQEGHSEIIVFKQKENAFYITQDDGVMSVSLEGVFFQ